jgi:hypothetical protein
MRGALAAIIKSMTEPNEFKVIIRRKIPFLTDLFNYLFIFLIILAFILAAAIAPSKTNEMHSIYFISIFPKNTYGILAFCLISSILFLFLYKNMRRYIHANLTFLPDCIQIKGMSVNIVASIDSIIEVYCIEPKNTEGISKQQAIFYFEQPNRQIRAKLKNYSETDDFMKQLLQYPTLKLHFYDWDFGVHSDAEK